MYERQLRDGNPLSSYPLYQSLERRRLGHHAWLSTHPVMMKFMAADNRTPRMPSICIECHRSRGNLRDVSRRPYRDDHVVFRKVCTCMAPCSPRARASPPPAAAICWYSIFSPEPHFTWGSLDCPADSKVSDPQQSFSSFNRRSQKSVAALRALFFKSGDVDPHVWDCRHSGARTRCGAAD